MDPTEGSSLPPDSITPMDALSTRHPNVTTENDSEVPNREPSLSTLDLATSAPIVESTGEISVPPEMDTVAPKVGDSVQTHPSSFDAGADSSLNGHASITAETNGVAVNGVKEAETLQTTNGVHFDQGAEEEPNHHENLPESGLSMGTKKKKKSKKKPKSQRGLVFNLSQSSAGHTLTLVCRMRLQASKSIMSMYLSLQKNMPRSEISTTCKYS